MEKKMIHRAAARLNVNHGWVNSHFTFANRADPENNRFGTLVALNEDTIAPGMGFGMHPHRNMEIITIPLEGALEHKDSMGNSEVTQNGNVQVMSAGTSVAHSEYNHNADKPLHLLQIWVLPSKNNIQPRYAQITIREEDRNNKLMQIVSPDQQEQQTWIHQDAWFYLGKFDQGASVVYDLKKSGNGIYSFIINGSASVNQNQLSAGDGIGLTGLDTINYFFHTSAEILVMEIPMS